MQRPAQEAARLLWSCRASGTVIEGLPEALRPCDAAACHSVQAALPGVTGQRVVVWKIAATSAAGQAHIQVDEPLSGRILEDFVRPMGATLTLVGNRVRVV